MQFFLQLFFESFIGGTIVAAVLEVVRQALHFCEAARGIVGVLVALAVTQMLHEPRDGVSQVQRHGFGDGLLGVGLHVRVAGVKSVGLGRQRQVDSGLGERQVSFRHAHEVDGLHGGDADAERGGVSESDVFRGHADQAARHVERVLSGFEHPAQPVERGVGIGVAHRLVQRRNQVVVLLARLIVEQHLALDGVFNDGFCDSGAAAGIAVRGGHRGFERVIRGARIAVRKDGDLPQQLF